MPNQGRLPDRQASFRWLHSAEDSMSTQNIYTARGGADDPRRSSTANGSSWGTWRPWSRPKPIAWKFSYREGGWGKTRAGAARGREAGPGARDCPGPGRPGEVGPRPGNPGLRSRSLPPVLVGLTKHMGVEALPSSSLVLRRAVSRTSSPRRAPRHAAVASPHPPTRGVSGPRPAFRGRHVPDGGGDQRCCERRGYPTRAMSGEWVRHVRSLPSG
jgi:hypothetical protein